MAMSTDKQYVPHEDDVRAVWVDRLGTDNPLFMDEAEDEFDRFLRRVRRDAWDEGFQDGRRYDGEGDDGPRYTNPYSGQDADQ